ncbi:Transposase, IS605 family [Geobacillus thermodenitrificans NG80-2]|uniref:Transposase, IS605 family n=1 Tax=Geobacillus thermodenitrificans (strain NG80-2) TaxID=420246 RepID=A4IPU1_GEOTN|nr:Transposase, IS605 family [Geobacillus thermodenitrificans NG80-2]
MSFFSISLLFSRSFSFLRSSSRRRSCSCGKMTRSSILPSLLSFVTGCHRSAAIVVLYRKRKEMDTMENRVKWLIRHGFLPHGEETDEKANYPRHYRQALDKLAKAQKILSCRKKGSVR